MALDFMKVFKGLNFAGQSSAPSSPGNGDVYYDSTLNKLRCYENGAWVNLSDSDGTVLLSDGSAAAPSLAFASAGNTNTGLFLNSTDSLGFSANGSNIGNYSSAGLWTLGASAGTQNHLVNGNWNIAAQGELRLQDSTGGEYVGHKAPATVTSSHTYTWPAALPGANNVLQSDSSGVLSWISVSAGGDVNNGGNSFGAAMTIGTNDPFALQFETNGVTKGSISSAGLWTIGEVAGSQTHVVNGSLNIGTGLTIASLTGVLKAASGVVSASTIVDADVSSSAAITRSKLANGTNNTFVTNNSSGVMQSTAVTASRAVVTDSNGLPTAATTTATEIGYVNGVTSAIQTQLNAKDLFLKNVTTVTNANYTILDNDGYSVFLYSTGNSDRTLTLPTAANNTGRIFYIKKTDSGTGKVTVTGTIDGVSNYDLNTQNMFITLSCNGTNYQIISLGSEVATANLDNTFTGGALKIVKNGNMVTVITTSAATHSSSSTPSSTAIIPTWARPAADKSTLYFMSGAGVFYVAIGSNGTLQTIYRDWAGSLISNTNAGVQICITYSV